MDLRRIAARIAEQLTLEDVQGESDHYGDPSPEERAVTGWDPKFKNYLRDKLGLQPGAKIAYEDAMQVLLDAGLDEKTASQYAMFASDDFEAKKNVNPEEKTGGVWETVMDT